MAASIDIGTSLVTAAASVRASPKKTAPKTLVKQAAAQPPMRASEAMAMMPARERAGVRAWTAPNIPAP